MTRALVLLHGVGGSAKAWSAQEAHFGPKLKTLSWNAPGYGGRTLPEKLSFEALATQLVDDLAAFGIDRCILVGHSFGGMVAQQVAQDHPGLLEKLVLVGSSPAFGNPDGDFQKRFIAERLGPLDEGRTMPDLAEAIVDGLVGDDADKNGMALARACMAEVPADTYRAVMQLLVTFELRHALARISVPTLVIAGEKDTNAPAPMMARMAEKISDAVFQCMEGTGHLQPMERPQIFNTLLDQFVFEDSYVTASAAQ